MAPFLSVPPSREANRCLPQVGGLRPSSPAHGVVSVPIASICSEALIIFGEHMQGHFQEWQVVRFLSIVAPSRSYSEVELRVGWESGGS